MKNIYLLSNQAKTSVSQHLDSISNPSRLRVLPILFVFLTLCCSSVWGAPVTETKDLKSAATSGSIDSHVSYSSAQGHGTTAPASTADGLRIYKPASGYSKGGYITVTAASGYEITSITFTNSNDKASAYKYSIDGGSLSASTNIAKNAPFTYNSTTFTTISFYNSGSERLTIASISVTYQSTGGGSTPTLSSIAVKTPPTKVSYTEGENFDPTGLVITRTYSDASTSDYTYAGHTSEFTFSPSTSTALTTSNTSVSITYGGKSTSQAITVTSGGGGGGGSTAKFVWGTNPSKYASESSSETEGLVTFTGAKGTHATTPARCYSDGLRMYAGNTVTFSVPDGYVITKIEGYATFNYNNATGEQSVTFSGLSKATCGSDVTVTYAAAVSYTITASSNNNAYGTVSVSGNIITATPASGYVANGYTLNSGTATISQSGNIYTVTPSSDCNITINFEPIPTYDIRFFNDGSQVGATQNIANGGTAVPPADPAGCDDFTFLGWWTSELPTDNTTTHTWVTDFTVTGAQDYYAAYSHAAGGSTIVSFDPAVDTSFPKGGITLSVSSGTLTNGTDYRVYKGGETLTITSTVGNISNIALTFENSSNDGGGWATNYTPNAASWTSPGTDGEQAHITSIVVTVGSVYYTTDIDCRDCSTPTLTFSNGGADVNKFVGDANFTITATPGSNPMGGTVTYSSNKPTKASVNSATGEVTIHEAMSDDPVTITATLSKEDDGINCQKKVTASYTLNIYNKVTWKVGEDEYTGGSPTAQTTQGGQITNFPSDPDGDALCGGKVFIGWTDHEVVDPVDVSPTPMYKALSDVSSIYINSNTTFYAVFAASGSGATPTLTKMGNGDTFSAGDKIVIVANYGDNDIALYQETTNSSYVQTWTFDNNAATVAADDKNWLTVSTATDGWYLGDNTNGYLYNGSNNLYCNASKTIWTLIDKHDGTFRLLSADDRFLSYRHDLSTTKWRMGGASQGTNGAVDLYLYKFTGSGTTYSDYATVCGTCLSAPTDPTVTPKSNRATITWTAVPDATGYTVTCTGGVTSVDGTTATITGLASETSYDFTIRSQGSDPYSCFPAYHGSFTTTPCEDSPVLGIVTVTTTTATITWTCEAATATIRVYEDAECNTQVGSDHTSCTSPYTVNALTSNTTYYYKVWAGGSCSSAVGSFKTEEIKLDIAEWQTDAVVVSFNGDANLTLTTLTEETHGDPHENVADDIFFSKYFEAAKNVKLLGIFNGTMHNVNLADYKLGLAQSSGAEKAFTFTKFSDFVKADELGLDAGGLTDDELLLKTNEEIILITYTNGDDDPIIACAKNDEEHSKYSTYIRISTPALQFNGDDVVSLLDPDGTMIDIIGAGTKAEGSKHSGASFETTSAKGTYHGFMDQPGGWYTANGYHALADNAEASGYGLSTNRCLLIRRKYVKSGYAAVERNTADFVTLGDYTYMGDNYEGEWKGVQIPGSTTEGTKPGLSNSCDGFAVLGGYNYNDYYVAFEISGTPTTFEDLKSDPFDGTYEIPVTGLIDKACTFVRIELKDGSDNLVIRKDVKVPIMISGSKNTTDDIFHSHYKDEDICRACDVIILNGGTLTKVPDGTTGDIYEVRDLKIYPGGKLIVPEGIGYNYTVNSLAFRRQEDEVATADIQGGLTVNEPNSVFLDIRIDPSNWHYISLPYDVNVSDITFSTGDPATLGADYLLKWYNGERRAATQAGGCWEMVSASGTLKKGIGYLFAIPGDGLIKREFRFPMANTVIAEDKGDKNVAGIYGYGCDKDYTQVRANHRGWNLIGNPYFLPYTSDITNPLLVGKIVPDYSTVPWDGHYKFDEAPATQLRYIVEPVNNGKSEYKQVAIEDYEMTPFTCYFVQVGGTDPTALQGVEFHIDHVERSPIVRRSPAEYEEKEDTHPVWCAINLTNSKGEKDITTMLISNDFTDEYDMMDDLVKMRGTYYQYSSITTAPVLASRNNEGEMAFNALPDSSAKAGIPLHYFTAYNGEYTISYNNKYDKNNEVVEVKLLDTKTNEWYDLKSNAYTFTTNREDNKNRFIVSVSVERQKAPQITTGIDALNAPNNMVRKIFINGHVYIQRGGAIYDITGKEVFNF